MKTEWKTHYKNPAKRSTPSQIRENYPAPRLLSSVYEDRNLKCLSSFRYVREDSKTKALFYRDQFGGNTEVVASSGELWTQLVGSDLPPQATPPSGTQSSFLHFIWCHYSRPKVSSPDTNCAATLLLFLYVSYQTLLEPLWLHCSTIPNQGCDVSLSGDEARATWTPSSAIYRETRNHPRSWRRQSIRCQENINKRKTGKGAGHWYYAP